MTAKRLKIVLFAIFALAFLNLKFEINGNKFPSAASVFKSDIFASRAEAKKKKKKTKKMSQKNGAEIFQNPLIVSGDDICQKNSREALKMLFLKDREDFNFVASNLGKIECAVSGSGVYPWETPTRFKVGVATSNAEPAWFASVLVHESCHVDQYKKNAGENHLGRVSAQDYSGEKAEIECLDVQIGALKNLGAGQSKIDYVANAARSRYWLLDISRRWW